VEHRQAQVRQTTSCRALGDDPARFLRELRQLRDGAGLGQAELAARAHYPYDRIRAAEVGPALPDLPVLSAYVRGCGGTSEEWEERWRSLTSAPTLPLLAARPAGCSTAASAGARIGSISQAADSPDPSIILAALDRVAEEMAVGQSASTPSRSGVATIEQRPGVAPAGAKSAAAKAGVGNAAASAASPTAAAPSKPTAWETTTARTAWGADAAPTAWDAGQPPASPESATAKANATKAVAADAVSTDSAPTVAPPAAADAVAAAAAPAAVSGPAAASRVFPALSRTTIVALIAVAICVLAMLALFA
jgi:hypothetical protein